MADDKKPSGKTRAGTPAKPFPWEEAISEQYERTKSRLKGLATEPKAELQRILEQYLPKKSDSPEERMQKLEDLAMGFAGTTIGKVGNVKVRSTVKDPDRMAFPGIYQRPDVIAAEAASRVAPESPNLKAVFGVTRDDLFEMGKGRKGNLPGALPGAAQKPRGSEAAARVMTRKNEQRLLDTMAEAEQHPELVRGMDPWYVMDPLFQRMEQLLGRERAIEEYTKFNTLMGMASPGSEVLTEIPRGTSAYYLQKQGRFPEFVEFAGLPEAKRGANFPVDIRNVPGHMYHKTSQALPMQRYLETGELQMDSPKVPLYIEASGVPETGFQTATPVGDAHWSRAVGLADTRGKKTLKGKEVVPGASVTNPEMTMLAPWWKDEIAAQLGLESVPAQARAWGTFSGQTGVTTPIGAPKLELIADKIAETARRLNIPLEKARDLVLTGEAYAGKKKGGAVKKAEGGTVSYELPDDVTPQNWRDQLETNVLNDARALIGVKEGGSINLDRLLEKAVRKANGGSANLDDMLKWAVAKHNHKMKKGGEVSQTFPLKKDEEDDLKPTPKYPLAEKLGKGVSAVHEFISKPFGYENPPGEMVSELLGVPGVAKTLERVAYGDPLTSGAGMTTNLLPETTETLFAGLGAAPVAVKGAKALAPTAAEMLEFQLAQSMKPYQMAIAPEGKAGKVKAPANPVGFYNPAEKAALNLQRKQGAGSAFVSDLQKTPGVNQERLTELGLGDLASRPNVTRDEIIAAAEQNRIPLRETVRRPYQESEEFSQTVEGLKQSNRYLEGGIQQMQDRIREVTESAPSSPLIDQYKSKIESMKQQIDKNNQRLASSKPSLFGPDVNSDFTLPGGENYREIRVQLPSTKKKMSYDEWLKGKNLGRWSSEGVSGEDFMHATHHGDEPNVLFHLRVADHTDAEGKRGLLIDELQSDWHQKGREKGYKSSFSKKEEERFKDLYNKHFNVGEKDLNEAEIKELQNLNKKRDLSLYGVPDAPFKDNWYQLGLKRAIKEAADTGMDRVYLTTGARQADRYDLSKHIDELVYQDGTLHAYKDGQLVIDKTGVPQDKLQDYVGKEAAKKLIDQKPNEYGTKSLGGLDLKVGGEGMKQYYDKTYKNYLDKYAKQFGGKVGETKIADGETVYYIDITPKMIESAKKGQSYAFGGGVFNTDPDITDSGRIIPEHTI